jgi:Papain family cysteine protease
VLAVSVNETPWQFYKNGIFTNTDDDCKLNDEASLNHAVLGVGYGTHKGKDFWIINNSWSTQWGENGYIRLAREAQGGGVCSVVLEVSYPYF